jgi:hypothetical protein
VLRKKTASVLIGCLLAMSRFEAEQHDLHDRRILLHLIRDVAVIAERGIVM